MLQQADISTSLNFSKGAKVTFSDTLEVSLDCCVCRRSMRTIVLEAGRAEGTCTPTGHPFPGRIVGKRAGARSVEYRIEYRYEPFEDAKYPVRRPQPCPGWARVSFTVTCPRCGASEEGSVQNNAHRPWTARCGCGQPLYTLTKEMPRLSPRDRSRAHPDVSLWARLRQLINR